MIGLKISDSKKLFFDRAKIEKAADKGILRVLSRFGAYIRTRARSSIRKRRRPAALGMPPSSHTGLLKKFLFFVYDRTRHNVIIGPARLSGPIGDAPHALEYGGRSEVWSRKGKRRVNIEAHPFMHPAFEAEKPKLPTMWADSIK